MIMRLDPKINISSVISAFFQNRMYIEYLLTRGKTFRKHIILDRSMRGNIVFSYDEKSCMVRATLSDIIFHDTTGHEADVTDLEYELNEVNDSLLYYVFPSFIVESRQTRTNGFIHDD